jgi:hypothetical protein
MTHIISMASACALALLLTGTTAAANDLTSRPLRVETYAAVPGAAVDDSAAQACRFDEAAQPSEPADPRWLWRLRAYRHLDCVITLADAALDDDAREGGGERDTVRLSREDLERIRILAWWARDAAARIGQ